MARRKPPLPTTLVEPDRAAKRKSRKPAAENPFGVGLRSQSPAEFLAALVSGPPWTLRSMRGRQPTPSPSEADVFVGSMSDSGTFVRPKRTAASHPRMSQNSAIPRPGRLHGLIPLVLMFDRPKGRLACGRAKPWPVGRDVCIRISRSLQIGPSAWRPARNTRSTNPCAACAIRPDRKAECRAARCRGAEHCRAEIESSETPNCRPSCRRASMFVLIVRARCQTTRRNQRVSTRTVPRGGPSASFTGVVGSTRRNDPNSPSCIRREGPS